MVFTYFKRAKFSLAEYTLEHFFLALYLASDIEEDVDEYKYDRDLVLDCMQLVENIFLESKSGEAKLEVVCEVLKPYFVDDVELVKKFIEVQFIRLSQANTIRKVGLKIFDFVLSFF